MMAQRQRQRPNQQQEQDGRSTEETVKDENEIRQGRDIQNYQLLDRLIRNDPTLKQLRLGSKSSSPRRASREEEESSRKFVEEFILPAIVALAANTSLETLHLCVESVVCPLTYALRENRTLKDLILTCSVPTLESFVQALPRDHRLESLAAYANNQASLDDDPALRILRKLCRTKLRVLSLSMHLLSANGAARIVRLLRDHDHCIETLDIFRGRTTLNDWQAEILLDVQRETWAKQYIKNGAPTIAATFAILERAKKVETERECVQPELVYHVVRQKPELVRQLLQSQRRHAQSNT